MSLLSYGATRDEVAVKGGRGFLDRQPDHCPGRTALATKGTHHIEANSYAVSSVVYSWGNPFHIPACAERVDSR